MRDIADIRSDLAKAYILKRRIRDDLNADENIGLLEYAEAMAECEMVVNLFKKELKEV